MRSINERYEEWIQGFVAAISRIPQPLEGYKGPPRTRKGRNPDNYTWVEAGVLLLRYIAHTGNLIAKNLQNTGDQQIYRKNISPRTIKPIAEKEMPNIAVPGGTYANIIKIYPKLYNIQDHYNTEDGQLRWLKDNLSTLDLWQSGIHLWQFWSIVPSSVRKKMTKWKKIDLPFQVATQLREKILKINREDVKEYNTEDGQIRRLEANKLEDIKSAMNLWHFWRIIPEEIKTQMTKWKKIDLPFALAKEIREKLLTIEEKYKTEDGYIDWLKDNNYEVNLGAFWSIIPEDIKKSMKKIWKRIDLPFKIAIKLREELADVDTNNPRYQEEDGQVCWLEDNGYDVNLWHFWSVVPRKIKELLKKWKKIDLPFKVAQKLREQLATIDESYNSEDGQLRWLQDNGYTLHWSDFWRIIPSEVRKKMTHWKRINTPFQVALERYGLTK